jgi:hypothetical protein
MYIMNKKSKENDSTYGLASERVAELLSIAADSEELHIGLSPEQEKEQLLLDRLAEPLLLDPSLVEMLPSIPSLLSNAMEICNGESIGEILLGSGTDIAVLRKIKNYSNKMSSRTESALERDVNIALYYASIAAALILHSKKITRFSYQDMEKSFVMLAEKKWISGKIAELFDKAAQMCRSEHTMPETILED